MPLSKVRVEIDALDKKIKELFCQRMQLSERVAQVKIATNDKVYKPDREVSMIAAQSADVDPSIRMEYRAVVKRIIEVSRKYQYGRILDAGKGPDFDLTMAKPEHTRTRIQFTCPNKCGMLSTLITAISDYGINISDLCTEKNADGRLLFTVELEANLLARETQALLFQLMSETDTFSILGSY